ncbi:CBF domain-containing protein, partial [Haematococcus lacustris]
MRGGDEMSELATVQRLCTELQSNPRGKANHVVKLVHTLSTSRNEAVLRASLQALKLFFIDASHDGALASDTPSSTISSPPPSASAAGDDAVGVYCAWVRRQYSNYIAACMQLIASSQSSASTQVGAAVAVMEAVRCEGGPATFSPPLFSRLLRALATEPGVKPEVFTLLFTRYFSFADVRYYALLAIKSLASEAASSKATSATPAAAAVTGRQEQVKRTVEPAA